MGVAGGWSSAFLPASAAATGRRWCPRPSWSLASSATLLALRLGLVVTCLVLIGRQVDEFRRQPVSTFYRETTGKFPRVTICPARQPEPHEWEPLLRLVAAGNMTMEEAFRRTTLAYPQDEHGQSGNNSVLVGRKRTLNSPPNDSVFGRWRFSRQLVNRWSSPCRDQRDYDRGRCLYDCMWRRIASVMGCRLPWMSSRIVRQVWPEVPAAEVPPCRALPQPRSLRGKPLVRHPDGNSSAFDGPWLKFVPDWMLYNTSGCHCLPACRAGSVSLEVRATNGVPVPAGTTQLNLKFDYKGQQSTERLTITIESLFSSIGGTVGLLLGFSAFSLVDLLRWLSRKMAAAEGRRHRPHPARKVPLMTHAAVERQNT